MDRVLVTVTPRIFSVLQQVLPGSEGGGGVEKKGDMKNANFC